MTTVDRFLGGPPTKRRHRNTKDIVIHVDSRDRVNFDETTSNSYTFLMPEILTNVVSATLVHAELPSSFYVFKESYGNTSFDVSFTHPEYNTTVRKTVTIRDGNYNVSLFPIAIANAMTEAFENEYTDDVTFKCAISFTTMRCILSSTIPGGILEIHTDTEESVEAFRETLTFFMGFDYGVDAIGETIESPSTVILNPFAYMMLSIRELDQVNRQGGLYGNRIGANGVFAKVPLPTNSFDYTFYQPPVEQEIGCHPILPRLDRLTVAWNFHNGLLVDFNDVEHSFSIKFTVIDPIPHESEDTEELKRIRHILTHRFKKTSLSPLDDSQDTDEESVDGKEKQLSKDIQKTFTPKLIVFLVIVLIIAGWFIFRKRST